MTALHFVLELGRAMHALGSPSYRVEDTMDACARSLGLEGAFFSTPTAIFAAIGEPGTEARTMLLRVAPGENDLARLAELYAIRDAVVGGTSNPDDGLRAVRDVLRRPRPRRPWRDIAACVLAAGGAAVLIGGGRDEVAVAAAAGVLVGGVTRLARWRPGLADVEAPLACALVAFAVNLAALVVPLHAPIATIAAIVVLLPGLSFTNALAELAMRHLAAGSARLMGTLATLLTMAIGVGLGERLAGLAAGKADVVPVERLGLPWHVLALAATWAAFQILLRADRRQAVWVLQAIALGYCGARLGSTVLGSELGAFVGALLVAAWANVFARWQRRPAAVVRTPGLLVLVPGSLGFRGLTTAVAGDFAASAPFVFQMLLVGGAIVAGLLMAGVLVPPPLDVEPENRQRPWQA